MGYHSFREVYHKLAIVLDNGALLDTLNAVQCHPKQEVNSALAYGYIDKTCGFSYKVLGLTYYEDGDYTLVWPGDEIGMTVRGECFHPYKIIPIENKALLKRFGNIIDSTNRCYSNADDEKTRSFTILDPFRHPDFPDDVTVLIQNHSLKKQEKIWARLTKYVGKSKEGIEAFKARLLSEPFHDVYQMHFNDEILVGLLPFPNGEAFLLGAKLK